MEKVYSGAVGIYFEMVHFLASEFLFKDSKHLLVSGYIWHVTRGFNLFKKTVGSCHKNK